MAVRKRVENFKYLGVILDEDPNRLARKNKKCLQNIFYATKMFKNENISKN
jgi:hypothetical protein